MSLPLDLQRELCRNVMFGLDTSWDLPKIPKENIPQTRGYLQKCHPSTWLQMSAPQQNDERVNFVRSLVFAVTASEANHQVATLVAESQANHEIVNSTPPNISTQEIN